MEPNRLPARAILCVSAVLFATCYHAGAFVPNYHPSSFISHHPVHKGHFIKGGSAVDGLVQLKSKPRGSGYRTLNIRDTNKSSKDRKQTILTQDRCSKTQTYRELNSQLEAENELLFIDAKRAETPPEQAYRVIPEIELQRKQEKLKKQSSKKPSIYTTTQSQQPAWLLQFSAAQQEVGKLKRQIQAIVNEPLVECADATLIFFSSVLVAITTLPNLPQELLAPMETVQQGLAYAFLVDFLTRWFSCTEKRGRYVTQPLVLVDVVVVVLPLLLPLLDTAFPDFGQSGLINLRLLRVLRLQRNLKDEMTFSRFVSAVRRNPNRSVIVQQWELQLARVLLSVFTLLSVAAGLIYTTEHDVNPNIDDYFTALYFTLTTLTTVGFGDITPMTWEGKLVVSGSILAGITIIPAQAATLVEALLQRGEEEQLREQQQNQRAPILESSSASVAAATTPPAAARPQQQQQQQQTPIIGSATLEATQKCPNCGVGLHWSHATYCYNCASPLHPETTTLVLPDHTP